jgi:primosomal replication protein N
VNQVSLSAQVLEVQPLRYTPAGQPALEMILDHESQVTEAGHPRRIQLQIPAVALGDTALLLADITLGTPLTVNGFLAPSRKGSAKMVLHVQHARRATAVNPVVV